MNHITGRLPWINEFDGPRKIDDAAYFDLSSNHWAQELERNWTIIQDEIQAALRNSPKTFRAYFKDDQVSDFGKWQLNPLCYWGIWFPWRSKPFPKTKAILKKIRGLTTATFSLLQPGSDIEAHFGDTDAIYRCHLGLIVPEGLPYCGIEVKGETRQWQQGKLLAFCDAHLHRAWNHSGNPRAILIIDVIRPEFEYCYGNICISIWFTVVLQWLESRAPLAIKPVRSLIKKTIIPIIKLIPRLSLE